MTWEIRRAVPGDEATLARIQTESWKAAFAQILTPQQMRERTNEEAIRQMYERVLVQKAVSGYLLYADGEPHAMAFWGNRRDERREGEAELICLHSMPARWRSGHGRRLMEQVEKDMAEAGYTQVMLWVFEDNMRARRFYEACGFEATEATKEGLGAPERMYRKQIGREA